MWNQKPTCAFLTHRMWAGCVAAWQPKNKNQKTEQANKNTNKQTKWRPELYCKTKTKKTVMPMSICNHGHAQWPASEVMAQIPRFKNQNTEQTNKNTNKQTKWRPELYGKTKTKKTVMPMSICNHGHAQWPASEVVAQIPRFVRLCWDEYTTACAWRLVYLNTYLHEIPTDNLCCVSLCSCHDARFQCFLREIMLFIGKPIGKSKMITKVFQLNNCIDSPRSVCSYVK